MPKPVYPFGARLWFGFVILTLGILWTLDNMGIIESGNILQWWPLVFVGVGLTKLAGWSGPNRPLTGFFWIGLGVLLLGITQDVIPLKIWQLWPLVLIGFGSVIVWRALHGQTMCNPSTAEKPGLDDGSSDSGLGGPPDVPEAAAISAVAVWAGVDRKNTSQSFRGGDFTAFMGGGTVDLRGARTVPEGAVVDIFVLMGGVDVIVPEDWHVVNEIFAFMGGVEDSRKSVPPAGRNVLRLRGACLMGGVEIKN